MKKTLLLCFIHGFKGGEDTFGHNFAFTEHLRELVAKELPKVDVKVVVYPKYETRGDLRECVGRFRDWLMNKVIDLEVQAGTPSPTIDPGVRTVLVGHSMGGIVAAETVIALTSDRLIHGSSDEGAQPPVEATDLNGLMFPYIQGVLGFDTPYLGIAPGVVAHGAEGHYNTARSALTQLSGLTGGLWGGSAAAAEESSSKSQPLAGLPAAGAPQEKRQSQQQHQPQQQSERSGSPWQKWGKVAMLAGAGAAVAAGGAAAWMNREQLTEGWAWTSSHLEFVGCLARGEELRRRVASMVRVNRELGVGFGNLYTRLGAAASSKQVSMVGTVLGSQRTFCNLPVRQEAGVWRDAVNDVATDETLAHMTMFEPKNNPGYEKLSKDATQLITKWTKDEWYESSSEEQPLSTESIEKIQA